MNRQRVARELLQAAREIASGSTSDDGQAGHRTAGVYEIDRQARVTMAPSGTVQKVKLTWDSPIIKGTAFPRVTPDIIAEHHKEVEDDMRRLSSMGRVKVKPKTVYYVPGAWAFAGTEAEIEVSDKYKDKEAVADLLLRRKFPAWPKSWK